jgi:hypothetical protein
MKYTKWKTQVKNTLKDILVINDALFDFKTKDEEISEELNDVGSDLHAKMYFLEKEKVLNFFSVLRMLLMPHLVQILSV